MNNADSFDLKMFTIEKFFHIFNIKIKTKELEQIKNTIIAYSNMYEGVHGSCKKVISLKTNS